MPERDTFLSQLDVGIENLKRDLMANLRSHGQGLVREAEKLGATELTGENAERPYINSLGILQGAAATIDTAAARLSVMTEQREIYLAQKAHLDRMANDPEYRAEVVAKRKRSEEHEAKRKAAIDNQCESRRVPVGGRSVGFRRCGKPHSHVIEGHKFCGTHAKAVRDRAASAGYRGMNEPTKEAALEEIRR